MSGVRVPPFSHTLPRPRRSALPEPLQSKETIVDDRRVRLVDVARWQRFLLLVIFANVALPLGGGLVFAVPGLVPGSPGTANLIENAIFWTVAAGCLLAVVLAGRLGRATGLEKDASVMLACCAAIPFFGIFTLALLNRRATGVLRRAGCKVGFLGVAKEQMLKLIDGACRGCGYDVRGIEGGKCPECGGEV